MSSNDLRFLRLAISLAREARERGADPFGAVLVRDGEVVAQASDRSVEMSDPTHHAELQVISEYCRANELFSLRGYELYASSEPCPMCAGAIHWARISRLVYSVSQAMIQERSGGATKPDCRGIINMGGVQQAEVVGPLLPDEGLTVFEGYAFTPKAERHKARLEGK